MEGNGTTDVSSPHSSGSAMGEGPQAVKVAVHIRPLIGAEVFQGCKDCVSVVPGEPQVQIGSHSFTFDHVYGSTGSPATAIFDECVAPLVEGLFQGYNATVLAYGQTGSGKTYTMGTGYTVGGSTEGIIPKVMELIFDRVTALKDRSEFQIRVSFIEILKEEVHDLLDPNPPIAVKSDAPSAFGSKSAPGKLIQIRENMNGEITLAGVTESGVRNLEEMAACLEQGSLCRATASTNMNTRSSRSHAIFTIALEQKRIAENLTKGSTGGCDEAADDFLCAKLHLVDLAGSERAKRTGADGVRFKEGVHINKGLLALGNVISALGDDKKRKEGGHVPYRDSKLTRLLQDSLGGNSRTVMIACISPADSNAEETLNTLKYANRTRNIQNKPIVNRDPMAAEMQRMRQQLEVLQAQILCMNEGGSFEETQILKQRIAWLETSLLEVQQDLRIARENLRQGTQHLLDTQVQRDKLQLKIEMLRNGKKWEEVNDDSESQGAGLLDSYAERIKILEEEIQRLRDTTSRSLAFGHQGYQDTTNSGPNNDSLVQSEVVEAAHMEEETVAKEMEHARLQDSLDKELEDLNRRLEQKEAEMRSFSKVDGVIIKQHFEKKIMELEEEKKTLQSERDKYLAELTSLANASDGHSQKLHETYAQKVKSLETQILELKKKQENQAQLMKQKQRSEEAAKRLQEEIQRIKSQKVQLQHKIKQESEQFRMWKALREKEVLQLKKEGRRNEYEMHKLQALHQRQKMVLQRKTEEAAAATRRLKDLLETRKANAREASTNGASTTNGPSGQNEKIMQNWLDYDLEVAVHIHKVRSSYEKETDTRAALAKELTQLKHEQDTQPTQLDNLSLTGGVSMSPGARRAKIALLESMLNASSSTLVAMASQLSEAEERERGFSGRARWQQVRSMGDAKNLLQAIFNLAVDARCKYWDKDLENKELRERFLELEGLLRQSEIHRQERERQQFAKEQQIFKMLTTATKAGTNATMKSCLEEISKHLIKLDESGPRQLQYPDKPMDSAASDNSCFEVQRGSGGQERTLPIHNADPDTTDISSGNEESDMDIDDIDEDVEDDDSDEDWCEMGKKLSSKTRNRKHKAEKSSSQIEQASIQEQAADLCCSCSKQSGCKTGKCACKASGSFCGSNCQCSSKKCANRGSGSESSEDAEILEAIETLELDKEIKSVQRRQADECDRTVADLLLKEEDVQRAEKVLAKHGASVLENVWTDELKSALSNVAKGVQPTNITQVIDEKGSYRKPLSDIGNSLQAAEADGQQKLKQRKRWGKALVQLVPTATQQHPISESQRQLQTGHQREMHSVETSVGTGARASDTPTIPLASHSAMPGSDNAPRFVPATSEVDGLQLYGVGPPRDAGKPFRHPKKKTLLSPPSSPLRARNNHAVEDNTMSKRMANTGTSASPRAPGKGVVQEKENV
ncbi:hypothetical protein GOP47_0020037 [Adiantum capillus-veneris]|uniref:Kinesin motor domain-containing protein n=1 Tax=Adiantum capillus-veneris TaxID=13818 RepID=A0A9D4UCN9_ADICA|nr:hypothetical protein GOP47_0020037 [Adiantum capillus-veneris]